MTLWLSWDVMVDRSLPWRSRWIFRASTFLPHAPKVFWVQGSSIRRLRVMMLVRDIHKPVLFSLHRTKEMGRIYVRLDGNISPYWAMRQVSLWRAEAFVHQDRSTHLLLGVYLGLMLLIILVSFFFYVFSRDGSYLWYTLFQGALVLYLVLAGPIGFVYLRDVWLSQATYLPLMQGMLGVFVFFYVMFGRSFLETRERAPKLDKLFLLIAVMALYHIGCTAFGWPEGNVPRFLGLIAPGLVGYAGWTRWRQGYRPALYYLLGQTIFALGSCAMVLESFGWLPGWELGLYWMMWGSAMEAILLSLALVDRMLVAREERKQLEQARQTAERHARKHEQRLELILNAVKGGVWDWALAQGAFSISPTFLSVHGYDPVIWDFSPSHWIAQIHPDDLNGILASVQRYIAKGESESTMDVEFRWKSKRGWRWILSQGRIVERNAQGEPCRVVGTFVDVTERKQSQQQMMRADKMASLGQLMGGIAHEINNPNNFVTFNLPLVKDALRALEPVLEEYAEENPGWRILHREPEAFLEQTCQLIDHMKYGAERISSLVAELKHFVRSHRRDDKRPMSIDVVVQHVEALLGKQMQQMVASFVVDVTPELPDVIINAGKIEQVLLNLLINAGQAAEEMADGEVCLRVFALGAGGADGDDVVPSALCIEVTDNGPGIPDELRERIFDPFFTTKATHVGTGLGLSISHQIIEDHGGTITVENLEQRGARFLVTLPTAERLAALESAGILGAFG